MSNYSYKGNSAPAANAVSITPNDSTDLTHPTRSLYIGTSGDLKVTTVAGDTVSFTNLAVGYHPLRVRRVFATGQPGTIASGIVGLY